MMTIFKTACISGILAASSCFVANAQQALEITDIKVSVDKPEFVALESPEFATNNTKNWRPKDWLEIEVKFAVTDVLPKIPADKTLPAVTIKWFVAIQDPSVKGKKYLRLERAIKHVNIPIGEEVYTSIYLSPSSVRRLSGGGDRADAGIIWGVGGEVIYKDRIIASFTNKNDRTKDGRPFWYDAGLSASNTVPLRNKNETPFINFWYDRYAEIAPKFEKEEDK